MQLIWKTKFIPTLYTQTKVYKKIMKKKLNKKCTKAVGNLHHTYNKQLNLAVSMPCISITQVH